MYPINLQSAVNCGYSSPSERIRTAINPIARQYSSYQVIAGDRKSSEMQLILIQIMALVAPTTYYFTWHFRNFDCLLRTFPRNVKQSCLSAWKCFVED